VTTPGRLLGIARRLAPRAPMEEVAAVRITPGGGVDGDARRRPGRRQVTVLARDAWEAALAECAAALSWTTRRANLYVEGLDLVGAAGAELHVGAGVRLLVTGETNPCARMEAAWPGLSGALARDWRGGVTCRVLRGGGIAVGDPVVLIPVDQRQHDAGGPVVRDVRRPV
jgi:MOSC domain-containing protein YiiM